MKTIVLIALVLVGLVSYPADLICFDDQGIFVGESVDRIVVSTGGESRAWDSSRFMYAFSGSGDYSYALYRKSDGRYREIGSGQEGVLVDYLHLGKLNEGTPGYISLYAKEFGYAHSEEEVLKEALRIAGTLEYTTELSEWKSIDDVYNSSKGACFEYAALFAGVMRGAGIETKIVVGDLGSDRHAWNECFLNGKWVLVDPALACTYQKAGIEYSLGHGADRYQADDVF